MVSLLQLQAGQAAKIVSIDGGRGLALRLNNLGIRKGASLVKITGYFKGGPVVVKVNSTQLALGRGMAAKVMVEPR